MFCISITVFTQKISHWQITATNINPTNYYGETVANGMIGVVSSPEPFKVKDVVLAGAYDQFGRGRVGNFFKSFNLLNMYLEVDGERISATNIQNFEQKIDMQNAAFTSTFNYGDKASILSTGDMYVIQF